MHRRASQSGRPRLSCQRGSILKLQQTIDDPDCSVDTAAKLVLNEPLLAAKVVAIANSAACNRGSDVTNVKAAISRLGFRTLRAIVSSLVIKHWPHQ
jgi:HD-like signal output (HDOD) protein